MLPTQKRQLEEYLKKIRTFHHNTYLLYSIGAVVILGTLIFHTYPSYAKVKQYKQDIHIATEAITETSEKLEEVHQESKRVEEQHNVVLKIWKPILDNVLPPHDPPIDAVTKFLEDFALTSDKTNHPMRIENIVFAPIQEAEDHSILPFRMTVEADQYNFDRFMKQIHISGSLLERDFWKGKEIPIMSIHNINVTLPPKDDIDPALLRLSGKDAVKNKKIPTFTFHVEMNAHFAPKENEVLQKKK